MEAFIALIPVGLILLFTWGFWNICYYQTPFPFVSLSKYQAIKERHQELQQEWNDLVDLINRKGGRDFLRRGIIPKTTVTSSSSPNKQRFTPAEVKLMVKFCHPDKAGNSPEVHELTLKLLDLMKRMK